MNLLVAWIVFAMVLFIAEILTPSFFLIWFGVGAVGAGIVVWFDPWVESRRWHTSSAKMRQKGNGGLVDSKSCEVRK